MAERQYTQKEWRFLSWWLATFHPHADISLNVRLGPTQTVATDRAVAETLGSGARVRNRWADAIFVENGLPNIVEAKLEPDPGIFSQLIHYARKFRADRQFEDFKDLPLTLIALVYNDDPSVAVEAPIYGVQWVSWQPDLMQLPPAAIQFSVLDLAGNPVVIASNWPARLKSWGIKALGA